MMEEHRCSHMQGYCELKLPSAQLTVSFMSPLFSWGRIQPTSLVLAYSPSRQR